MFERTTSTGPLVRTGVEGGSGDLGVDGDGSDDALDFETGHSETAKSVPSSINTTLFHAHLTALTEDTG